MASCHAESSSTAQIGEIGEMAGARRSLALAVSRFSVECAQRACEEAAQKKERAALIQRGASETIVLKALDLDLGPPRPLRSRKEELLAEERHRDGTLLGHTDRTLARTLALLRPLDAQHVACYIPATFSQRRPLPR